VSLEYPMMRKTSVVKVSFGKAGFPLRKPFEIAEEMANDDVPDSVK